MREIKFRAWSKNDKHIGEPFDLYDELILKGLGPNETGWLDDTIFMQFTGLHDKNGKEIYEGDLLKSWQFYDGQVVFDKYITDNKDDEDILGWCVQTDERYYALDPQSTYEVIGNIYENKDLL